MFNINYYNFIKYNLEYNMAIDKSLKQLLIKDILEISK